MNPIVDIVVFGLLSLGLVCTLIRLLLGPTLSDRVVALDLLGFVILGFIAANIVRSGEWFSLDVLPVAAVILFIGTVAFARYIEKRSL